MAAGTRASLLRRETTCSPAARQLGKSNHSRRLLVCRVGGRLVKRTRISGGQWLGGAAVVRRPCKGSRGSRARAYYSPNQCMGSISYLSTHIFSRLHHTLESLKTSNNLDMRLRVDLSMCSTATARQIRLCRKSPVVPLSGLSTSLGDALAL